MAQHIQTATAEPFDPNQRVTLPPHVIAYLDASDIFGKQQFGIYAPRAWCQLAHQHVRNEITIPQAVSTCTRLLLGQCGLTDCKAGCIFLHLDDPIWDDIRRSEELRRN